MRTIREIDREIDVLRRERLRRTKAHVKTHGPVLGINMHSMFPELEARETALFRERGIVQLLRDAAAISDKRLREKALKEFAVKYGPTA